jgi:hypothetical protein
MAADCTPTFSGHAVIRRSRYPVHTPQDVGQGAVDLCVFVWPFHPQDFAARRKGRILSYEGYIDPAGFSYIVELTRNVMGVTHASKAE